MKLRLTPPTTPDNNSTPEQRLLLRLTGGGEDPKDVIAEEMRVLYKRPLRYNNNISAIDTARSAAAKAGINPALLFSSSFQEGFNKAIAKPDEVSEAYLKAKIGSDFPVDGFYNYGLDRFGERYEDFTKRGYLPQDFGQRVKIYDAVNEKGEKIKTAAFKTDEDALIAKAAFIRAEADDIQNYAKQKGIDLDEAAQNYFTMAAYNSGAGNARKMLEKYAAAKDKAAWLESGDAEWQKVHKNVAPRLKHMKLATELLNETNPL
jgi:hypothetical protein